MKRILDHPLVWKTFQDDSLPIVGGVVEVSNVRFGLSGNIDINTVLLLAYDFIALSTLVARIEWSEPDTFGVALGGALLSDVHFPTDSTQTCLRVCAKQVVSGQASLEAAHEQNGKETADHPT